MPVENIAQREKNMQKARKDWKIYGDLQKDLKCCEVLKNRRRVFPGTYC